MKKSLRILVLTMACLICLSLCACGSNEAPAEETPASAYPAPVEETAAPAEEPPAEEPAEDLKAIAETFIQKDVKELFEAIGMPIESSYAPSCLGDGEDGEHHYDGFVVYTYKEGDSEIVQVVL